MAKKKSGPSPAESLERQIRATIDKCPELKPLGEEGHFEAVEEALDLILDGVKARLYEIREENENID